MLFYVCASPSGRSFYIVRWISSLHSYHTSSIYIKYITSTITQVLTIKLNTTLDPEVHNEACVFSTVGQLNWGDPQCQISSVQVFTSDCCIHLCIMWLPLVSTGVDDHTQVGSWPVHGERRQVDWGIHMKREDDIITFLCFNFRNWANGSMFFWGEKLHNLSTFKLKSRSHTLKQQLFQLNTAPGPVLYLNIEVMCCPQKIISEFAQVTHSNWQLVKRLLC